MNLEVSISTAYLSVSVSNLVIGILAGAWVLGEILYLVNIVVTVLHDSDC